MKSIFARVLLSSLFIIFMMACALMPAGLLPATAILPPTDTAIPTLTPIPPTVTPTLTPAPSLTPTATPNYLATQEAMLQATKTEKEARVKKEMAKLDLAVEKGRLAWVSSAPVTLSTTDYGRMVYDYIDASKEYANFIFKTDVSWISKSGLAGCGVTFRMSSSDVGTASMYDFFAIRLSGVPAWDFTYYENGRFKTDLMGKTQVDRVIDLSQGGTNTFVVQADGNKLTAYANGKRLGTATFDRLKSGSLAWFVSQESGETSCTFSNAWLWELP